MDDHRNDRERLLQPTTIWGGPNTALPRPVESFLSWSLALSCLSVSGYHFVVDTYIRPYIQSVVHCISRRLQSITTGTRTSTLTLKDANQTAATATAAATATFPCWLPIMTYSRAELSRATPNERLDQAIAVLQQHVLQQYHAGGSKFKPDIDSRNDDRAADSWRNLSDHDLVRRIRENDILRRLVSLAMRPSSSSPHDDEYDSTTANHRHIDQQVVAAFRQQLIRIWPQLLALPTSSPRRLEDRSGRESQAIDISLIVPCYQERVSDIVQKISHALHHCTNPERVQVVIVLAGRQMTSGSINQALLCSSPQAASNDNWERWGKVTIVPFAEESGRGPCLNHGAAHATGYIFAFCHSDTKLPPHWDVKLWVTLKEEDDGGTSQSSLHHTTRTNSCAFGFGIDTTPEGLSSGGGGLPPPGIRAVETTANLRCRLWSLPYGDQCLALRRFDFLYLGGFPHQCFMEDYELIALLRKRVRLLPQFRPKHSTPLLDGSESPLPHDEVLTIVPGAPALCSPRRWQKFGVLYVTYTNSKLVNLYARGTTPDELYRLYYGQELAIVAPLSPWEVELKALLAV